MDIQRLVMFIALFNGIKGTTLQERRFKKRGLPSGEFLLYHTNYFDSFSVVMCSKACVEQSGCKSFSITTQGDCRLFNKAFTAGSNNNANMGYYIKHGEDITCVHTIGFEYDGYLAKTRTNKTCLRWDSVNSSYTDKNFRDGSIAKAENFCREPKMSDARVWCFVSADITWEYCDIGFCCLPDKVREYAGNVSITNSGLTCQRWDKQKPHKHTYNHFSAYENHCRADEDSPDVTWCYTMNEDLRWEYCGIQKC